MSEDIIMQYLGPYTILTTDVTLSPQIVECVSIAIDRNQLKEYEIPVDQSKECIS